jgi:hypothetical protein
VINALDFLLRTPMVGHDDGNPAGNNAVADDDEIKTVSDLAIHIL